MQLTYFGKQSYWNDSDTCQGNQKYIHESGAELETDESFKLALTYDDDFFYVGCQDKNIWKLINTIYMIQTGFQMY